MSDKLKVAVLYDVWEEDPPVAEPEPEKPKRRSTKKRRKKEEKHDREEIFEALQKLGHEPLPGARRPYAVALRAAQVRRRSRVQSDRVLWRRRHQGDERRSVYGPCRHALYR